MSMRNLADVIDKARWAGYWQYHCAQRRKAVNRDALKAVKGLKWSAKIRCGDTVLITAELADGFKVVDMIGKACDAPTWHKKLSMMTLELMQHVARATKDRLDGNPAKR